MHEFQPFFSPDEGISSPTDEPDEGSVDDVSEQLEQNDELLKKAGHLPSDTPSGTLSDEEIRARIRDKANELNRDELEAPEKAQSQIRDFLTTVNIKGANLASDEEIELLWGSLLKNPSLVKDFVYFLTNRNTTNNYCEFPLLPDMKDLLEFADDLSNPETLRPKVIKDAADNLAGFGFNRATMLEIAMESHGPRQAEQMRMLGWLAGFPFMRDAQLEIISHHQDMDIGPITVETIAHAFIVLVSKNLDVIKGRTISEYHQNFKMDREARDFTHQAVVQSLQGISSLLDKTFL